MRIGPPLARSDSEEPSEESSKDSESTEEDNVKKVNTAVD